MSPDGPTFLTPLQVALLAVAAGEGPLLLFTGLALLAQRLAREELDQGQAPAGTRGGFGLIGFLAGAASATAGILIPYLLYEPCVVARFAAEAAITTFPPYLLLFPAMWPVMSAVAFGKTLAASLRALRDHGHTKGAWDLVDVAVGAPRGLLAILAIVMGLLHVLFAAVPLAGTLAIHSDRVVADQLFSPARTYRYDQIRSLTVRYTTLTRKSIRMRHIRIAFTVGDEYWDTDSAPDLLRERIEARIRPQLDLVATRAKLRITD